MSKRGNGKENKENMKDLLKTLEKTKAALREAIMRKTRVQRKLVDYDPAGLTYEIDWLPEVKEWAKLADLQLGNPVAGHHHD